MFIVPRSLECILACYNASPVGAWAFCQMKPQFHPCLTDGTMTFASFRALCHPYKCNTYCLIQGTMLLYKRNTYVNIYTNLIPSLRRLGKHTSSSFTNLMNSTITNVDIKNRLVNVTVFLCRSPWTRKDKRLKMKVGRIEFGSTRLSEADPTVG
jgi:hypothetical protein